MYRAAYLEKYIHFNILIAFSLNKLDKLTYVKMEAKKNLCFFLFNDNFISNQHLFEIIVFAKLIRVTKKRNIVLLLYTILSGMYIYFRDMKLSTNF